MKQKLNRYVVFLIPVIFNILSIFFYYIREFLLGNTFIVISLLYIYREFNKEKDTDEIEELVVKIKANISDNISNMSYPLALINDNGDIIWVNKRLKEDFSLVDLKEENILSIARNLDLHKLLTCDKDLSQRIKIRDSFYSIYANEIVDESFKDRHIYLVYFIEVSNLRDFHSTKESIMLIEVDNLSEALDRTEEVNRPMLVADVESMINSYGQKMKAMIVKYDFNKYVLSVQDKYIYDEINSKFNILERISSIDRGNKLEVTLSIGIGMGSPTPQENYHNAATAKELALGRGGDQVAVKTNDKITFFGGNTREIEKRTRVRARVIAQALKELIFESSNVFIVGHKNPDMDCLGASIGIWSTVKQLGKSCNIILNNDTNAIEYYIEKLKSDTKYDNIFISAEDANLNINEKTLLIVMDVHNRGYVQNLDIVEKIARKIIIDHHRRSPDIIEGALLNYIEVYASSTSEMVTELIQYMLQKPRITKIEAEGLLAGIVMDTKGFEFKAGVRTFDAAAFLRELGADTLEVKKMFTDSFNDYLLIAETIKNARVRENLAIAICPKDISNSVIVARAADELLSISEIDVCFVLCEINNNVIISGRSVGDVNVQVILEEIGGGGHMNMAGAKLNVSIDDAIMMLENSISKHSS